jgi:hypothetical protein
MRHSTPSSIVVTGCLEIHRHCRMYVCGVSGFLRKVKAVVLTVPLKKPRSRNEIIDQLYNLIM